MISSRNKRIIVDLDGVVVDSYGQRICDAAKELFDMDMCPSDFKHYDLAVGTSLSQEQISQIFNKPGYYRDPLPMPRAIEMLTELYNEGFEQHIITARPNDAETRADTLNWLASYRVPMDSLYIMSKHGTHEMTADSKIEVARKLNAGYAVEDNPFNARSYATICDVVFLVNNNLNAGEPMPDNVVRVNDLFDMAQYLRYDVATNQITNSNAKGLAA